MHNQLKIFEKAEFGSVRVVMKEDEPWFVAKDVCNALGYVWKGVATIGHIPEEWRGVYSVQTPSGEQEMLILSESGLYFFLGRSDKPAALPYQKWIAGDVVPTIRKTGHYGEWNLPRIPKSFPDALRMIADIEEEKQLAIEQRDYYRRTKAEIGSRREATAMATASVAVRKAAALENELGRGRDYKSVKGIPWFLDVFADTPAAYSVAGRKLSDMSRRMDYEIREIEDSRFGIVKAYHVDVIEAFRLALKNDLNMMRKYRK